jgi:hypothetical protein
VSGGFLCLSRRENGGNTRVWFLKGGKLVDKYILDKVQVKQGSKHDASNVHYRCERTQRLRSEQYTLFRSSVLIFSSRQEKCRSTKEKMGGPILAKTAQAWIGMPCYFCCCCWLWWIIDDDEVEALKELVLANRLVWTCLPSSRMAPVTAEYLKHPVEWLGKEDVCVAVGSQVTFHSQMCLYTRVAFQRTCQQSVHISLYPHLASLLLDPAACPTFGLRLVKYAFCSGMWPLVTVLEAMLLREFYSEI